MEAAETLWTAIAGPATATELLRVLSELPEEERKELAKRCSDEAKGPLKKLLRPYETEASREALSRTLG